MSPAGRPLGRPGRSGPPRVAGRRGRAPERTPETGTDQLDPGAQPDLAGPSDLDAGPAPALDAGPAPALDDISAETGPVGPPPATSARSRILPSGSRGRRFAAGLVAVLVAADIAFGVWSAVLGLRHAHQDAVSAASRQALTAATHAAGPVTSYDYQHFPADVATASRYLTKSFAGQYQQLATKDTAPTAAKYHVVVKGTVAAAAVEQASTSQVSVMVFLDQSSTSTLHSGPRVDQSRLLMRMQNVAGKWLVSGVQAL